jgi:hypothetical protein
MQKAKQKNSSAFNIIITGRGCLLTVFMVSIGLLAGVAGTTFFLPQLMNFRATETMIWQQAAATNTALAGFGFVINVTNEASIAQATQLAVAAANTQQAQANAAQSTQIALDNASVLLNQTATQSSQNIVATLTANAVLNAEQMTQIALNYAATQAQLQQNATEVELNFQATRAALNNPNNAAAQNLPTSIPTATSTPLLPRTPVATPTFSTARVLIDADFSSGLDTQIWRFSDTWRVVEDGIEATGANFDDAPNNTLYSNQIIRGNYQIQVTFVPSLASTAGYRFGFENQFEYTEEVRILTEALKITRVHVQPFSPAPNIEPYIVWSPNLTLTSETTLVIDVNGRSVTVSINEQIIGTTELPYISREGGEVGVYFPQGAILKQFTVIQNP